MLSNEERAGYGYEAVRAGSSSTLAAPTNEDSSRTDAGDAIANILHWLFGMSSSRSLDAREQFALSALDSARTHFTAELRGEL